MSLRPRFLPALATALLITISCGGDPPDKELQQAESALAAALAAGADKYAADEYAAARASLTNAREAVTQRDYRLALDRALDSREHAQVAARQAADGKVAARTDAEKALSTAEAELDAVETTLKTAEAVPAAARLLIGPRATVDTARKALQEARATFDRGEYLEVPGKARSATASLQGVTEAIGSATAPPTRRRR